MRRYIYLLAALAAASLASAGAQTTGGGGNAGGGSQGSGAQRSQSSRTPSQPTPARNRVPTTSTQQALPPANTTVAPPNTTVVPPNTTVVPPNTTVVPPNTTPASPASNTSAMNPATQQNRVPPAARGVGTGNRPDCSNMRGLEKSECERRDTSRDDLPAGVTTTQPKNPQQ